MSQFIAKLQSVSDVITNSSSELFTVVDERPFKEVKKIIEQIGESNWPSNWEEYWDLPEDKQKEYDSSSGEGGELSVRNWRDLYEEWLEWIPENKKYQAIPEIWSLQYEEPLEELKKLIWVRIDWNRKLTIDWVLKNLWVVDADGGCFEKDPETGRVLKRISYEEAEKLPEERKISW